MLVYDYKVDLHYTRTQYLFHSADFHIELFHGWLQQLLQVVDIAYSRTNFGQWSNDFNKNQSKFLTQNSVTENGADVNKEDVASNSDWGLGHQRNWERF